LLSLFIFIVINNKSHTKLATKNKMRCPARDNDIFYAANRLPVFLPLSNSLYHRVLSNISCTHLINRRRRLQRFKVNRFSNHTNKMYAVGICVYSMQQSLQKLTE